MRILSAMFDRLFVEGGFRRFVYRLLAGGAVLATLNEILTNGFTGDAYIYAFVSVLFVAGIYGD